MIIELKEMFREARWFWVVVAATMLAGTGARMFFRSGKGNASVALASVDGEVITQHYFKHKLRKEERMRDQLRQWGIQMGPINNKEIFSQCVREAVINNIAAQIYLDISDKTLSDHIKKTLPKEIFEEKGGVDLDVYERNIKYSHGSSVAEFEENQRSHLSRELLKDLLRESLSLPGRLAIIESDNDLEKSFEVLALSSRDLESKIKEEIVTEQSIKDYYEANKKSFLNTGKAILKVFVIQKDLIADKVALNEKELADYYDRVKHKKYSSEKNYTVDFWVFENKRSEGEGKEEATKNKSNFINKCKDKNIVENFEECCTLAKKKGLDLKIIRNHKIKLGSGEFSQPIEKGIRTLTTNGEFSSAIDIDAQTYFIRLVSKEGANIKDFNEVRAEIEAHVKSKKTDYELKKIANALYKKVKDDTKMINDDFLDFFQSEIGDLQDSVVFREVTIGAKKTDDDATTKILSDALGHKIDLLETGKVGRTADDTQEIIYVVDKTEKRSPLAFEKVSSEIESLLVRQESAKQLAEITKSIKEHLITKGAWPDKYKKQLSSLEPTSKAKLKEEGRFSGKVIDNMFRLFSPKQVLTTSEEKDGKVFSFIIKCTASDEENRVVAKTIPFEGEVGQTELLDGLVENAKIDMYLDLQ